MTEIERIIQKGIVSEDFLKEEIRSGYLVSTERKKIWTVILDLIVELDRICKKHNIHYYLDGGSLLGAVRHNGFIPWDDDIDVTMPRDDYERFVQLSEEFKHPYFLQTPYTDPEYFYSFAKIRNSNTTALNQMFKYQMFNHGIWISVFPLDKFPIEKGEELYLKIRSLTYENSTFMRMKNPFLDEDNRKRVDEYSGRNPVQTFEEIQHLAQTYNGVETDYWGTIILTIVRYGRKPLLRKSYDDVEYHMFENLFLPIPIGFDEVLRTEYGNYMELPPEEERGGHDTTIFDPEHPYTMYQNNPQ